jgi:hypothetical protein
MNTELSTSQSYADYAPDSASMPPDFPPIDPPEDDEGHNFKPRPERLDVPVTPEMWAGLRLMMERAGVDVEAALAEAIRPEKLDPETAFAWQLDAAFHHLGLTGVKIHDAAKVDKDMIVMKRSDGTESEILVT